MAEENSNIIEATGYLEGYKTKGRVDVELNFKFPESELTHSLQFLTGIGSKLKLIAVVGEKKLKLGTFTFNNYSVDRDANSKVRFKSNIDSCDINIFSEMLTEVNEENTIVLKAKVIEE